MCFVAHIFFILPLERSEELELQLGMGTGAKPTQTGMRPEGYQLWGDGWDP